MGRLWVYISVQKNCWLSVSLQNRGELLVKSVTDQYVYQDCFILGRIFNIGNIALFRDIENINWDSFLWLLMVRSFSSWCDPIISDLFHRNTHFGQNRKYTFQNTKCGIFREEMHAPKCKIHNLGISRNPRAGLPRGSGTAQHPRNTCCWGGGKLWR